MLRIVVFKPIGLNKGS